MDGGQQLVRHLDRPFAGAAHFGAIEPVHVAAEFGGDIVDHYTYVLASDGDLMEGISHEAISLAGHLKLKKLIVLFDDNAVTIDGSTSLSDATDQMKRFRAAGWNTARDVSGWGEVLLSSGWVMRPKFRTRVGERES